ncbi:hypothetical protein GCM10007320_50850 [Pseudorhodoferax aquiterrae]|uniref:Uncharacterized protein n=1 Tax=Pseudorhodoferax aquiterrae TaxID=747304 RepID=A0ABQ3G8A7_9BURK|nr:hypothetical protein [Pseudorhodoferax aquiterrae]GHC96680.1 hypothetical protein GCM10007320_50850 [Pseudorhodoferax aquiterrae]
MTEETKVDYAERRRPKCQSISEANLVLEKLAEMWDGWFEQHSFFDIMFAPLWANPDISGAAQLDEMEAAENAKEWQGKKMTQAEHEGVVKITLVTVICAYCIQAFREKKNSPAAWSYVADANRWLGVLQGLMTRVGGGRKALLASDVGRMGAASAHAENRAMKAVVHEWCDANMANYKSMDAAATDVAGKLVPVVFRTARDWIGEWKKLRSAGRP